MTLYDISHWSLTNGHNGLLLFAQSLEELFASHSHDSHKVPALNFHFICYEILNVIELVENNVLEKGNLPPLYEEMEQLFNQDKIAQKILGNDFKDIFSKKNAKGEYERKPIRFDKDAEISLAILKRGILFVLSEFDRKKQYYEMLKNEIKTQISSCGGDLKQLYELQKLTRIIASELINTGYSQYYIYDCIKKTFFSEEKHIDSLDVVDEFFQCFAPKESKYCVYMSLNSVKQKRAIEGYGLFEIAENIHEMFDPSIPYILKYECDALDPYGAREITVRLINMCLSVNQFIKHTRYNYNAKYADVVNTETHKVTFIKKPEPVITRRNAECEQLKVNEILDVCLKLQGGGFQVLQLHSSALMSSNIDNQLINLWTSVEVIIPVYRKEGLSRINQISNALTAVLGSDYFSVLAKRLFSDINSVDGSLANEITNIGCGETTVSKIMAVLVLPEYEAVYNSVVQKLLEKAPLLACRMYQYKNNWSTKEGIKEAYVLHSERLSQQIMRIYRTRNMLVHDGSMMPYTEYVLQNLHYYIDSLIEFLNQYSQSGFKSVERIIDSAQFQERKYLQLLSSGGEINKDNLNDLLIRSVSI